MFGSNKVNRMTVIVIGVLDYTYEGSDSQEL